MLSTLLGKEKIDMLNLCCDIVLNVQGSAIEFGVYKGGSLELIAKQFPKRNVYGVDNFGGGLVTKNEGIDVCELGQFADSDYDKIADYFFKKYPNVRVINGIFPECAYLIPEGEFAFAHIDFDQYKSTYDACQYIYPRMAKGGIMLFDDYEWHLCPGVKIAIFKYFRDLDRSALPKDMRKCKLTSQYVVIK